MKWPSQDKMTLRNFKIYLDIRKGIIESKLKGTTVTKITNYRKENFSSFGLSENLFCHIDANWFMTV